MEKDRWSEIYDLESEEYKEHTRPAILHIAEKLGLTEKIVAKVLEENGRYYEQQIHSTLNFD